MTVRDTIHHFSALDTENLPDRLIRSSRSSDIILRRDLPLFPAFYFPTLEPTILNDEVSAT